MKEIGPIIGIDCKNTTKITIKERMIAISRTREIGENNNKRSTNCCAKWHL